MIELVIFILPTFISMVMNDYLNKNEKTIYDIIKTFGEYCCLNNMIAMAGVFIYKGGNVNINQNLEMFGFVFEYFVLAIIIATILPIIIEFIKKNVSINIVFKEIENEKDN